MKILFDARLHQPYMTGMSRYMVSLLKNLLTIDTKNEYIILINSKIDKDNTIFKELKSFNNIKFEISDISHMGPINQFKMPRLIKEINPDIYHYPHLDVPISGIPTVCTIHDTAILYGIKKFKDYIGLKSFYIKYILKRSIEKSDKVIFISNSTKNEIVEKLKIKSDKKFGVIYNGIDEHFAKLPEVNYDINKKYNLPQNYILYIGMIRPHKNIERMIEAVKLLDSDIPLILVGKEYEKYKIDLNSDKVIHIEQVNEDDLKLLYKNALCFLFPSLIEGFGLPILESMSLGTPVITSNFGAMKEVAGDAGVLVNSHDINDIAQKLKLVIEDEVKRKELIYKGDLRVKDFSWRNTAKEVLNVYKELYNETKN